MSKGSDLITAHSVESGYSHRDIGASTVLSAYPGLTYTALLNDLPANFNAWDILKKTENLDELDMGISGNLIYSLNTIPEELSDPESNHYQIKFRARTDADVPFGTSSNIDDKVDRYETEMTVETTDGDIVFKVPNEIAKYVFWPEEPGIPPVPIASFDPNVNLADYLAAAGRLYEILTSEDYSVERSRLENRNTESPLPGVLHPWLPTETQLAGQLEDPVATDTGVIKVTLADYVSKSSGEKQEILEDKLLRYASPEAVKTAMSQMRF